MAILNLIPGRLKTINLTGAGNSDWVALKTNRNPFEVSLAVDGDASVTGLDATVEYTMADDPDTAPATAIIDHPNLASVTGHADDKLEWPVTHVRLRVDAITAGSVDFKILQPGSA